MPDNVQTQLPNNVLDFLSDFEAVRFAETFVKTYGLTEADVPRVMTLAEDVVYGDVALANLPDEMVAQFGIEQTKAKQAALELAEARLLPIQESIPGIAQQIRAWGGEVKLSNAIKASALTPEVFVQTTLQDVLQEMPDHLQGRLAHILELYVSKHSDPALIIGMLTKSEKVGGVEFEKEDAEALLKFVDEKMAGKKIENEQEKKKEEPIILAPPIVLNESVPVVEVVVPQKIVEPVRNEEEDAKEIEKIKLEKLTAMTTPVATPMTVEEMVGQICSLEPMQLPDGTLADRCRQVVDSRLREVRTAEETQKLIERSVETGGLGISGRKLADMMQAIERAADAFLKHSAEKVAKDKTAYLEKQQTQELEKQSLAEREERMMTKRYVELTGKMPSEHVSPVAPSSSRVSGAVSQQETLTSREQNIDTEKVRNVIEASKKESVSDKPASSSVKPSVQDVKFVKRLSGPIDELGAMSLVDFRRMAKSPELATEKILSLVQLVEDQGYEKRVEAIRAWQSSPLYQQYLAIARLAMQEGNPLEDTRMTLEKTSETLTKEELKAILVLNGELRF